MERVLVIVGKLFTRLFGANGLTPLKRLIYYCQSVPLLQIGIVFMIIGFAVSILSRIIHSR